MEGGRARGGGRWWIVLYIGIFKESRYTPYSDVHRASRYNHNRRICTRISVQGFVFAIRRHAYALYHVEIRLLHVGIATIFTMQKGIRFIN